MMGLTPAQADFVRIVAELHALSGRPPSYSEVQRELCSGSKSRVFELARCARERGWLLPGRKLLLLRELPPPPECPVELTDAGRAYCAPAANSSRRSSPSSEGG